jgi:DNA repair photolyase
VFAAPDPFGAFEPVEDDRRKLLVAALAHAVDQRGRRNALFLGPKVLVQLEELPFDRRCDRVPLPVSLVQLGRHLGKLPLLIPGDPVDLRAELGDDLTDLCHLRLELLTLLHQYEQLVLAIASAAPQILDFVLQGAELLGIRDAAVVKALLFIGGLAVERVDLVLEPTLVAVELVRAEPELSEACLGGVGLVPRSIDPLPGLEQGSPRDQTVDRGVDLLELEEPVHAAHRERSLQAPPPVHGWTRRGLRGIEHMFYPRWVPEQLFEIARRTFDTPEFRGIEFIEAECKSIINRVQGTYLPFKWSINPYRGCTHACSYCFARPTHTFLDMDAGRDFERNIVVKVNAPEVLRRQLGAKRWNGEGIAMGTNTDPYQRAEGRYRLMPQIIGALTDFRNPFSILTKGTLILRDLDLLVKAAAVTDVATAFSIGTLDDEAWRRSEPGTPHPRKRIEAVAALNAAGIPCGVLMAPILPGITDHPRQLREVAKAAIDAGATHVSPILLHLRPGVREEFMPWLAEHYPDLVDRYEALYAQPYAPAADRRVLGNRVSGIVRALGGTRPAPEAPRRWRHTRDSGGSGAPEQLKLA